MVRWGRKKIQNPRNGKAEGEIEYQNIENQDKTERDGGKPPKGRSPVEKQYPLKNQGNAFQEILHHLFFSA